MNILLRQQWYAVYTAPRAEKKVAERLREIGVEYYLPLKTVRRQWSDRVKEVIVPVISGYIFVYTHKRQFRQILDIQGVSSFVREFNTPVAIPVAQMNTLRFMCDYSDSEVALSMESFQPGDVVKVVKGPLLGLMGELVEIKGKHKVAIRLEKLGYAHTSIPLSFLEKV